MKNKIHMTLGLVVVVMLMLGVAGFAYANTYQYINTSGQLASVVANTPAEALATAYQRASNSGVMLVGGGGVMGGGQGMYTYQYINTSGQIATVMAHTPEEALRTAYQRAVHSGVMLLR